jgi:uncharacterized protein
MAHPNEDLIRRAYAAFGAGDLDTLKSMMTDDVVYHIGGSNLLTGDYHGQDDVIAMFVRVFELTGGTIRLDLQDALANDDHAVAFVVAHGERDGQTLAAHQVQVFNLSGEKASEVWLFADDQAAVDKFYS